MEQGSEIAKLVCEDENVEPQVCAVPIAFGSPDGVPLVGVRACAAESGDGYWLVHMKTTIDKDGDSNGLAEIVELNSTDDYALMLTKCGWRANCWRLSAAALLALSGRTAHSLTDGG